MSAATPSPDSGEATGHHTSTKGDGSWSTTAAQIADLQGGGCHTAPAALTPDTSLDGQTPMTRSASNEGALDALRQLRRAVEEAGHGKQPRIREAMDQATIVLGRGY